MNDRDWIRATLQRFEAPLLLYAARLCHGAGGSERARDVVQETFLELCRAERADVEPRLAAWLFTVCRNKALDLRRKDEGMQIVADSGSKSVETDARASAELDPPAQLARGEETSRVIAQLARLPERQQEALRLKFQGGLSYREIAAVMGTTAGNVGVLVHMGLRAMKERLAVEGRVA